MKKAIFFALVSSLLLTGCHQTYETVKVTKPRIHKSWYKNHVHKKRVGYGKIRLKLFEKQGTKTVRMRG